HARQPKLAGRGPRRLGRRNCVDVDLFLVGNISSEKNLPQCTPVGRRGLDGPAERSARRAWPPPTCDFAAITRKPHAFHVGMAPTQNNDAGGGESMAHRTPPDRFAPRTGPRETPRLPRAIHRPADLRGVL